MSKNKCLVSTITFEEGEDLHPQLVKQARQSGQLNLSNRGLVSVPDKEPNHHLELKMLTFFYCLTYRVNKARKNQLEI